MRNNQLTRYVLKKNIWAAVLGMAVSSINTIIDAFLMGNLLGPEALSAINLSMPLNYALVALQCVLASGASLLTSRKLGERDHEGADRVFTVSLLSVMAAGLLLTLLAAWITVPIVNLLCSRPELTELAREYCRVELLCSLAIMFQIALSSFAQRAGNPKTVLNANMASLVINIVMDIVYVRVLNMGIGGAALATGTGALAACAVALCSLVKEKPLCLRMPGRDGLKILITNMGTGLAEALQSIAISILTFVLNYFIQRTEGTDGMFVLSVGMNFLSLTLFFAMGVQSIYTSLGGMLYGQGDDTGLEMLLKNAVRIALPITCAMVLLQLLIPGQIARAFGARTQEQLTMAARGLRLMSLYSIPLAVLMILIANYQVLGYFALASGGSAGMLATLPLCLWLIEIALPAAWIWIAMPISGMLTILLLILGSELYRQRAPQALLPVTLMQRAPQEKAIYESTIELRKGDRSGLIAFTEQTVPFFEGLNIDRKGSVRIRLCLEEMLDAIVSHSRRDCEVADVRIVATEETVNILIRDNLPPCNPLSGEDQATNRRILEIFCPKLDYRNSFMQNVNVMGWNLGQ